MMADEKSIDIEIAESVADEPKEVVFDVTGQAGGPSPEEQAMVDAEQLEIMARQKAAHDAAMADERANHDAKIERAAAKQQVAVDRLAKIEARLDALEAK